MTSKIPAWYKTIVLPRYFCFSPPVSKCSISLLHVVNPQSSFAAICLVWRVCQKPTGSRFPQYCWKTFSSPFEPPWWIRTDILWAAFSFAQYFLCYNGVNGFDRRSGLLIDKGEVKRLPESSSIGSNGHRASDAVLVFEELPAFLKQFVRLKASSP